MRLDLTHRNPPPEKNPMDDPVQHHGYGPPRRKLDPKREPGD